MSGCDSPSQSVGAVGMDRASLGHRRDCTERRDGPFEPNVSSRFGRMKGGDTEPVQGPAFYFPSIEKKYGQPISYWLDLIASSGLTTHKASSRMVCLLDVLERAYWVLGFDRVPRAWVAAWPQRDNMGRAEQLGGGGSA
jgi:hypothetical protein